MEIIRNIYTKPDKGTSLYRRKLTLWQRFKVWIRVRK